MVSLGKRAAEGQGHSAPKKQRFIEEFLSGRFRNAVDSSSSEDEQEPLEKLNGDDRTKCIGLSDDIVDTPKTDLTLDSPGTPERKLTLPVRGTPAPPLAVESAKGTNDHSAYPKPGRNSENEVPSLQSKQTARVSAVTPKSAVQHNPVPPSRSLFEMWGKPAPTPPKQESQPTPGASQRRGRGGRRTANRNLPNGTMAEADEEPVAFQGQAEDAYAVNPLPKGPIPSHLPPEILRGMYTSPPGVKAKPGLNRNLPPLSRIEDIFDDIARTALKHGFEKVLDHLKCRELRVATMFSGTESPLLALDMLKNSELS